MRPWHQVLIQNISYVAWSESRVNAITPKFKSFSEFLVWADLNVK